MLRTLIILQFMLTCLVSFSQEVKPEVLLLKLEEAAGGWDNLYNLGDVQFDYNYEYPDQGY